jgi:hypothetical protein
VSALVAVAAVLACARAGQAPKDVLAAYAEALARGDRRAAYDQLAASYRARVSFAEFDQAQAASGEATARLQAAARGPSRIELPLGAAERVALVEEGGRWRLEEPPAGQFGQGSPRAALRTFIAAARAGNFTVLLGLAPARQATGLTPAKLQAFWRGSESERLQRLLDELARAVDAPIHEDGDEAIMPYGPGRQVRFVREGDRWRVEGLE